MNAGAIGGPAIAAELDGKDSVRYPSRIPAKRVEFVDSRPLGRAFYPSSPVHLSTPLSVALRGASSRPTWRLAGATLSAFLSAEKTHGNAQYATFDQLSR